MRLMTAHAKLAQHVDAKIERAPERLAIKCHDAALLKFVRVDAAHGAREYLEMGKVLLDDVDKLDGFFFVIDGDDEKLGATGSGRVQEIEPRGVAVEYFDAETPNNRHVIGVEIKDRGGYAVGA